MTIKCPKCGTKINAAAIMGSKGGRTEGKSKARTSAQARKAALARWSKPRPRTKGAK